MKTKYTTTTTRSKIAALTACGGLFLGPSLALAAESDDTAKDGVAKETPSTMENRSWLSLSGKVTTTNPESFMLNYWDGTIKVEMDDYDWYPEGNKLLQGDDVIVYGRIDADPFEARTIEAGSVWVKGLNTFFYANDADEEDFVSYMNYTTIYPDMSLSGKVTKIDGKAVMLDTGNAKPVRVDVSGLAYDPLDEEGYQKLEVGDRLWVSGVYEENFFIKDRLNAETVVTLKKSEKKDS